MPDSRSHLLTTRERAFVAAYFGPARGNGAAAARLAGYTGKNARFYASRLLTKANIRAAVERRVQAREDQMIADADERDKVLSAILWDEEADDGDRIRAAIELNRCSGRHSMTHHLKGRLTLEQALGESRQGDE